jgi:two-component system chemotaxis response regulator CheB
MAEDNARYEPNCIYVAPPNRHLLIHDGVMKLDAGPRENGSRPSIDPLFRSAARTHRQRGVGVILSGTLDDGSAGLFAVKARGGIAIVQDPSDAESPEMPLNALRNVKADYCLPLAEISPVLAELASKELPGGEPDQEKQKNMSESRRDLLAPPGLMKEPPSDETALSLVCPECGGVLFEQKDGEFAHFLCHVGHSFSPMTLTEAHKDVLERALWTAVRTLNERVLMHRQFLRRQRNAGEEALFKRFEESAASAERDVQLLREIIARI